MNLTESQKNGDTPLLSPFVEIGGRWFVIVEWRPDEPVLSRLTLRLLSQQESRWLEPRLADAHAEVWATLFPTDNAIETGGDPSGNDK